VSRIVLDASAGVEWVLRTDIGLRVEQAVASSEIWVPEHFYVETSAAIRRLHLSGQPTEERASIALSRLIEMPTHRVQIRPLLSEAWTRRHNVTMADALYVVMAKHLGATLVTADQDLANAPTLDVKTLVP
jgi:predicted nucleic acid-binding protein